MMENAVLPEIKAWPSQSPGFYFPNNTKHWDKGGKGEKELKKDDKWMARHMAHGFVSVNSDFAYTCVFSDLTEEQINKYNCQKSFSRILEYERPELFRIVTKMDSLEYLIALENAFKEEMRGSEAWLSEDWRERINRHRNDREEILSMPYINIGKSKSRTYTKLGWACRDYMITLLGDDHIRVWERDCEKIVLENYGPACPNYIKSNMDQYISWMMCCENTAQQYTGYAREHPSVKMIERLYEHEFSDEAMDIICKGQTAICFYIGRTKGFSYDGLFEARRRKIMGIECPV